MKKKRKILSLILALVLTDGIIPSSGVVKANASEVKAAIDNTYSAHEFNGDITDTEEFNDDWKFCLEPEGDASAKDYSESGWSDVTLPHDWSIEQDFDSKVGTGVGALPGGNGWYRKHFILPQSVKGKRINIDFDGVYQDSYIYVNGRLVGNYPNGYVPFSFDITDYVVCDGQTENVIAVSVTNVTEEGGGGYTSRWYSGSGIYRDVYMSITDEVHVQKYGVQIRTPNLEKQYSTGKATVELWTTVENESDKAADITIRNTVMNYYGVKEYSGAKPTESSVVTVQAGSEYAVWQQIDVENPKLWTIDSPALYIMKTEVLKDGQVVDTYETRFGFKYFNFDSDTGFSLNGEWMKLQGVCLHHDQGALGAVGNEAAFRRQIKIMKDMGINAIRTSHNAASPVFIRLCDEMGIMVFEESFDSWWMGKNDSDYGKQFFKTMCTYPGIESGITWAQYDLQQIVKKDRNSPSIIMWSIGNECTETTYEEAIAFAPDIVNWVKDVDEDHPVSMGENKYKLDWSNPTIMKQVDDALDLVGLNYGEAYYDSLHKEKPDWKIFGSETTSTVSSRGYYAAPWISGDHAVDNVDGNLAEDAVSGKQLSDYDNRTARFGRNVTEALTFDRDRQFIAGQFVWTGFDYIGEPTPFYGTAKSSYFGIVDTCGFAKDRFYLYQSQWTNVSDNPMVHIMPHWNWEDTNARNKVTYPDKSKIEYLEEAERVDYDAEDVGKIPVRIYSNAPAVELFVDGVSQGKKEFAQMTTNYGKPYQQESKDSDRLYLEWPLEWEYAVGTTIEAVAYDKNGKEIARDKVVTAGDEAQLSASADRTVIRSDGKDLSYITVDVKDSDGNFCPNAANRIEFSIVGDGEIVGVDNGDPVSRESYKEKNGAWTRSAFSGKALVIVRSTKEEGSFTVTAQSSGLSSSSVTVKTVNETINLSDDIDDSKYAPEPTPIVTPAIQVPIITDSPKIFDNTQNTVAASFKKAGLVYKITDAKKKTVSIEGVSKKNVKKVVIPKNVKNAGVLYKVTSIRKNAFKNCKKLKTLVIKSTGIKSIKKNAFSGCRKKVNVKLPKSKEKVYRKMLKRAGLKL